MISGIESVILKLEALRRRQLLPAEAFKRLDEGGSSRDGSGITRSCNPPYFITLRKWCQTSMLLKGLRSELWAARYAA